jgi:hypothetical protein
MKFKTLCVTIILASCLSSCENGSNSQTVSQPQEGNLDPTFSPPLIDSTSTVPVIEQPKSPEEQLKDEGWEQMQFGNGIMPDCYNYRPQTGELNNTLTVNVGGGTDVAIKVMSLTDNRCVRYVFINSGSTYSIRNLPEDRYYLKIAYGKDWISKTENNLCLGKFMHQALYKKSDQVLDFNKQSTLDGYQVPSFELSLDVVSGENRASFDASGISEDEFNN